MRGSGEAASRQESGRVPQMEPTMISIRVLSTAAAIGLAVGVAAYFAGPWLAGLASGVGGFVTALGVHAGLWLRRVWQEGSVFSA